MLKRVFTKEEYKEVEPLYVKRGVQYYLLHVNPQEQEDGSIVAIEDTYDHMPTDEDKTALYAAWLEMEKRVKLAEITKYDTSENVNIFEFNGMRAWLDKATRVGLQNSLQIEKSSGKTTTTLYLNDVRIDMPIDTALQMLAQLELYAIECYRTTEEHKSNVLASESIEYVNGYDYTTGYPEHPQFQS